jgi:subtilisin family serine protease
MFKNKILNVAYLAIGLFLFSGCSNSKTAESVTSQNTSEACTSAVMANRYVVQWEDGTYTVEYGKSDADFKKNFIEKKLALIKHVDNDHRIQLKIQNTNDVTALAGGGLNWGPDKVEAPSVWSQGFHGENVLVGVVDGMVDATHQQLAANISSVQQFNSEKNDPSRNKHGSHVSGIIAADPTSGPVVGIAPKAKIVGGQFIANDGGGSLGDAIIAMNSVASRGAKIINMSWGGAPCVQNLKSALEQLSNKGILLVTAAGNEGTNSDYSPSYPAAFNLLNQLNVAATTVDDFMIYFSNRGFRTVNVAAPGVGIFSTIPGNQTESMDGTSMAAPIVSGVAALLLSARPTATAGQIKTAILNSVDIGTNTLQVSSHGRINARRALLELERVLP